VSGFIFNFKKQFAPKVESGEKRQTIRGVRKDRRFPKLGDTVHAWTGLRTAYARRLAIGRVTSCSRVLLRIPHLMPWEILIDGVTLDNDQSAAFAQADGFAHSLEMLSWFKSTYGVDEFEGFCVRWEPVTESVARVLKSKAAA
jgi:hypothetical protein